MFFYGHPQNRFWKVLAAVLGEPIPQDIPEKRQMLLSHGVALWDSIAQCEIAGSSDASIDGRGPERSLPHLRRRGDPSGLLQREEILGDVPPVS